MLKLCVHAADSIRHMHDVVLAHIVSFYCGVATHRLRVALLHGTCHPRRIPLPHVFNTVGYNQTIF